MQSNVLQCGGKIFHSAKNIFAKKHNPRSFLGVPTGT
jgi:hypothetical protein